MAKFKPVSGRRPRPMIGQKLTPARRLKFANLEPKRPHTVRDVAIPGEPVGIKMSATEREGDGWWWVQTDLGGNEWLGLFNFKL